MFDGIDDRSSLLVLTLPIVAVAGSVPPVAAVPVPTIANDSGSTTYIKGEYSRHSMQRGFLYWYQCSECPARFEDSADEMSAPVLCHKCSIGGTGTKRSRHRRLGRPGAAGKRVNKKSKRPDHDAS